MRALHKLRLRMRSLLHRRSVERELETELRFHLDQQIEENLAAGMPADEARTAALRAIGGLAQFQEECRDMRRLNLIDDLSRDLRYAGRTLRREPSFTLVVIATLALGIGASTAIFSVCNAILLKPLPYPQPDRLVMLWEQGRNTPPSRVSAANFVDWRAQSHSFGQMAAINPSVDYVLTGRGEPQRLAGAAVSADFFSLLGTQMGAGRYFSRGEDEPGGSHVAILSYGAWFRTFGGRPEAIGTPIVLNDDSYTVLGVLPRDFELVGKPSDFEAHGGIDVWTPLALGKPEPWKRGTHPLRVFGRLKPGVNPAQAQAEMNLIGSNLARLYPQNNRDKGITVVGLAEQMRNPVRTAVTTLMIAVGLMLMIASANIGNLMLSRAAGRQKEIALRHALGAGRGRIARQLLIESILLAGIGGIAGLLLAVAAVRGIQPWLPADLPRSSAIGIDTAAILFVGAVSLVAGLIFGLAPLSQIRQVTANVSLQDGTRIIGGVQHRIRSVLAVGQMAFSLMLLIGAGLMAKSFHALMSVSPGFRTEHILTADLSLPQSHYRDARKIATFQRELLERIRSGPGVQSAGLTANLPLSGSDNTWSFDIEGRGPWPRDVDPTAKYRVVTPGYFETLAIPMVEGRAFAAGDSEDAPLVVIVNQAMARNWWPGANPIGHRLLFHGRPVWRTVIGVVGNVRHGGLDDTAQPEIYVPFSQMANLQLPSTLVLRTATDPTALSGLVRQAVRAVDPNLPVDRIQTMQQVVSASVGEPRFRTTLVGAFALMALIIASIGIYGVVSYGVSQRTREFGVRIAMGATANDVLSMVLRRALFLIGSGLALGLLGSAALTRSISGLLYDVKPLDGATFVGVPLLLCIVALLASYVPARRATDVDPIIALKHE
jgi:predicted permease